MTKTTFKHLDRVHRAMKNAQPSEYSSVMSSVCALMGVPWAERDLELVTKIDNSRSQFPLETRVQRYKRKQDVHDDLPF